MRIFSFRASSFRALGIVLGAFWALTALAGAAQAKSVTLSYVGYMAGMPVMNLRTTVELPDGAAPGDGPYSVKASMETTGNLARLYPFGQSLTSEGQLSSGRPRPAQHRSRAVIWNEERVVTMTYQPSGDVTILAEPDTLQAQQATREGYAVGTIDPASAVVALASVFARQHKCTGEFALFDGARRYDLVLEQGGYSEVQRMEQSYYEGSATECRATPRLVAGFRAAATEAGLYPKSARLWMAPAIAEFPNVPVRIVAQNALGEMVLDLVGVR